MNGEIKEQKYVYIEKYVINNINISKNNDEIIIELKLKKRIIKGRIFSHI